MAEACYILHLADAAAARCVADACKPVGPASYTVTDGGIKWCSGGGDFHPGDVFGAGLDDLCPAIPVGWTMDSAGLACEQVCSRPNATSCVGFTLYAADDRSETPRMCCFRTGSVASMPASSGSTTRCYAKHSAMSCKDPR